MHERSRSCICHPGKHVCKELDRTYPNRKRLSRSRRLYRSRIYLSKKSQGSPKWDLICPRCGIFTECGLSTAKRNINWARHAHKTAVALSSPRARAACEVGPRFSTIMRQGRGSEATEAIFCLQGKKASSYRGAYRVPLFN